MGDRGNIVVLDSLYPQNGQVFLYTHWGGSELESYAITALKKNDRWDDSQYLARIVFQAMVGTDEGTTGFGITSTIGDNEYDLLVLDTASQRMFRVPEEQHQDLHAYCRGHRDEGKAFADVVTP